MPNFEDDPSILKQMTSEQLEELLRKVREQNRLQEMGEEYQDEEEVERERREERHEGGERLLEDDADEEIAKVLYDIAEYRKKIIDNEEDLEEAAEKFVELNTLLLNDESKKLFEVHKGLELMMILYKQKGQANLRPFIIKTLDYALSNNQTLCNKFVDMLGLPLLFSFYMKKESIEKKKKSKKLFVYKQSKDEEEEDDYHCLSILANMLLCCTKVNFDRCFYKFIENSFEKTERLIELYKQYLICIREEQEENDDNTRYQTLQIISFILIFLCPKLFKNLKITLDSENEKEIDGDSILLSKLNDESLNKHLDMLMRINKINKEVVLCASYELIKTTGISAIQRYIISNEKENLTEVDEAKFRTVSQNPSESESEESKLKYKRFKESENEED